MRRIAILAAAAIGSLVASNSFAAYSFSTTRTQLTGANANLQRVTLFALATETTGDVFAADLSMTAGQANGLKFSVSAPDPDTGEQTVSFLASDAQISTISRSRANSTIFGTLAPGFPNPPTASPAGPATYSPGVTSFQIVGFDGRPSGTDLGAKAGADLNGGRGAAIISAVVPTDVLVTFAGLLSDDSAVSQQFAFSITNGGPDVPEPASIAALGAAGLLLGRRRK